MPEVAFSGTGEIGLEQWVLEAFPDAVMALLKDLFKMEEKYPDVEWTGFRVMGSVHQGNGYPVYHLELFAADPKGSTRVYSGNQSAPNIKRVEHERWPPENW